MLKKLLYIISTITLIISIICIILGIFEIVYSHSEKILWKDYDLTVNRMNINKLQNKYTETQILWLHEGEELKPKTDKKRILIIGDSYIWGDGYANANLIWWQQLRNKLLENGYNDVEIIAAGVSGLTTKQEFEKMVEERLIERVEPDLIIFGFVENDFEVLEPYDDDPFWDLAISDNMFQERYNNQLEKATGPLAPILKKLYPNIYETANKLLEEKKNFIYSKIEESIIRSEKTADGYVKYVLNPLKEYLAPTGIPYFFVLVPHYDYSEENVEPVFNYAFDKAGITFYNLRYAFLKESGDYEEGVYDINPNNGHPGTKATEFSSREVLRILEANYSSIIGKKTEVDMDEIIINDTMPGSINLQKIDEETFTFRYPKSNEEDSFLWMPIRKKYIKLNFMYPVDIESIEINGERIKNCDLYIQKINPEVGYDEQVFFKTKYSSKYKWNIKTEKVTSINLHLDIKNNDETMVTIKIKK